MSDLTIEGTREQRTQNVYYFATIKRRGSILEVKFMYSFTQAKYITQRVYYNGMYQNKTVIKFLRYMNIPMNVREFMHYIANTIDARA